MAFACHDLDALGNLMHAHLRDETNLEALNDELVEMVADTLQPAHVSLWLSSDSAPSGRERQG